MFPSVVNKLMAQNLNTNNLNESSDHGEASPDWPLHPAASFRHFSMFCSFIGPSVLPARLFPAAFPPRPAFSTAATRGGMGTKVLGRAPGVHTLSQHRFVDIQGVFFLFRRFVSFFATIFFLRQEGAYYLVVFFLKFGWWGWEQAFA